MFEGEKTLVFWMGLIIVGLASVGLFTIIWLNTLYYPEYYQTYYLKYHVPFIVCGVVFLLIGLYMMKSGVKKKAES